MTTKQTKFLPRLTVRWFNGLGCQVAEVSAFDEQDAAEQLVAMIRDAGNRIEDGDRFEIRKAA